MALKFKSEAEFRRFVAQNPKIRLAASQGAAPIVTSEPTGRLEVVAKAPERPDRGPWRERLRRALAWLFVAVAGAGSLGVWTCVVVAETRGYW